MITLYRSFEIDSNPPLNKKTPLSHELPLTTTPLRFEL
jgi:hypothetical protein